MYTLDYFVSLRMTAALSIAKQGNGQAFAGCMEAPILEATRETGSSNEGISGQATNAPGRYAAR